MSPDPPPTPAPEKLTPEVWVARLRSPELSPYWLAAIITKTLEGVITSWNLGAERIFGYTAYARVEDRLLALRSGYQTHIPKPVELDELVAVTYSLVRRAG